MEYQQECDSAAIASSATKFYTWYLANLSRPDESWTNKKLDIQTESYFESLANLKILSDSFMELENKRFATCIDSASKITYQRILYCGCSVGMLVEECQFLDNFYWISTNEVYDGFVINRIDCNGTSAECELKFYYNAPSIHMIDESFSARIWLSKYGSEWLIDKIEPERTRRN